MTKKRHTHDCSVSSDNSCRVFSGDEVEKIRQIQLFSRAGGIAVGLFLSLIIALMSLSFIPFSTISDLSRDVGKIAALMDERQKNLNEAIKKMRSQIWWINKYTEEISKKLLEESNTRAPLEKNTEKGKKLLEEINI